MIPEEMRALQAFLLIEDIMRYRHNIKILMLDDLSDDEIPEYIANLLVEHYENIPTSRNLPEGNSFHFSILLFSF